MQFATRSCSCAAATAWPRAKRRRARRGSCAPTARCCRSRGARGARRARARCGAAGDARRGVDALPRVRLAAAARRDRPRPPAARLRLDAVPPPALDPKPGARTPGDPRLRAVAEKIAPLRLAVRDDAPARVNLLIPTIDLAALLRRLHRQAQPRAPAGRARPARADRHRRPGRPAAAVLAPRARGLQRARRAVRRGRGRVRPRVAGHRGQPRATRFVATTWWTAHIARARARGRWTPSGSST